MLAALPIVLNAILPFFLRKPIEEFRQLIRITS